jgi:hypothetical protein
VYITLNQLESVGKQWHFQLAMWSSDQVAAVAVHCLLLADLQKLHLPADLFLHVC